MSPETKALIGIVGHAGDKFTPETEARAREIIRDILGRVDGAVLVSGGCHLGGIDIFAEQEADKLGLDKRIFLPKSRRWEGGYKQRNLLIASTSTEAHCIVVGDYPDEYSLPRYGARKDGSPYCYHCHDARPTHVKSGGCWTVKRAKAAGIPAHWHII